MDDLFFLSLIALLGVSIPMCAASPCAFTDFDLEELIANFLAFV